MKTPQKAAAVISVFGILFIMDIIQRHVFFVSESRKQVGLSPSMFPKSDFCLLPLFPFAFPHPSVHPSIQRDIKAGRQVNKRGCSKYIPFCWWGKEKEKEKLFFFACSRTINRKQDCFRYLSVIRSMDPVRRIRVLGRKRNHATSTASSEFADTPFEQKDSRSPFYCVSQNLSL